jgi:hypothetical protein
MYTKRPPASRKSARLAWDTFVKIYGDRLKKMHYTILSYGVWVATLDSLDKDKCEYDEIDGLEILSRLRTRQ